MSEIKRRHREPSYSEGRIRHTLIFILNHTGVIPYQYLELLPYNKQSIQKKIGEMKKSKEIEEYTNKKNGAWYRAFYIVNYKDTIKPYIPYIPTGYPEYYRDNIAILTSEFKRRNRNDCERIYCNAGIIMMMDGLQVIYGRGYKPRLESKADIPQDTTIYYTDSEIKKYTHYRATYSTNTLNKQRELTYSRVNGLLFSKDDDYAVYNIGKLVGRWNKRGEKKIKVKLNQIVTRKRYGRDEVAAAILFSNSIKLLQNEYAPLNDRNSFEAITQNYSRVLFFPMTLVGQKNLKIVLAENHWQVICDMIYGYTPERDSRQTWYDFYTDGTYDLLFCVPDIRKLSLFVNKADDIGDRSKLRIICFDYQKEFLKIVSQGLCRISVCSIDEAYEEFLNLYISK